MANIKNSEFWDSLYQFGQQGWDIGYPSPPICSFLEKEVPKDTKILIPGAGNAYEAECLHKAGFTDVSVLDFAETALTNFRNRCPDFPKEKILCEDFYRHSRQYELIIEQTFFSSVQPEMRECFVDKIYDLLMPGGRYAGLLFKHEFECEGPPFGAQDNDYLNFFSGKFEILRFETAQNSIKPRAGRELFFIFRKGRLTK